MHQTRHLVKKIPLCVSFEIEWDKERCSTPKQLFSIFSYQEFTKEIYDAERINFASLDESCVSRFIDLYAWNNRSEQFRGNKKIISRAFIRWRLISAAFNSGQRFHHQWWNEFWKFDLLCAFFFSNFEVCENIAIYPELKIK